MRCLFALLVMVLGPFAFAADLSLRERQMAKAIQTSVMKAGSNYAAGNFDQAGESIREAMRQVEEASKLGSPELYDALEPAMKRIEKAHTMLEFEGVSLPPFRRPERPTDAPAMASPVKATKPAPAKPAPTKPAPTKPAPTKPGPTRTAPRKPAAGNPPSEPESMISFTKTVAPILLTRCGRCHASDSKGGFNLATFAALMKGPPEGVVIFAGDTVGSRLIETIETGDMPRGGKVTPEELQTLKAWIISGAKFDGPDPSAPIAGGAAPPPTDTNPPPEVRRSTGNETVSFAADVAPLLVKNCNGCHIDAMQTRGGLRMDTFAQLFRGGDSGAVVTPGKGEQSLLVKKLRGMVGEQMPAGGRPALSDDSIKLISTWIDEGATLDGASETQPLGVMSQLAWAASATPEQMSERRQQLAEANMKLVTASGGNVTSKVTDHFFVVGSASSGTLDLVAELAESQMKTVKSVVTAGEGDAFFHGRATLFVLPKRYDYSEFAKMVEGRGLPASWNSHWQFDGIDAYASLVATERDDKDEIADRLAAPLISLAVATRGGGVPRWLAEGVGVATASRNANTRDRDARRKVEAEISQALAAMTGAKQFLDGKMSPEQTDHIGAAIATSLLDRTHRRSFDAMLRSLDGGKPFERAFSESFRVTPTQFVESWMKWARGG